MHAGFVLAVALAFAFALTNGFHDASNAIATLVATRAARPLQAVVLASVFNVLGPLVLGAAVADTIGGIVTLAPAKAIEVIGAGLVAAVAWNVLTWWLGLPSSSGHALVGGLVGAGVLEGGVDAIRWGGLDGWHPVGVFGTLIAGRLAGRRGARGPARDPRAALDRAPRDPALEGARARRAVGDGRRAGVQPRRQRRAEGGRDRRRAAARGWADRAPGAADVGRARQRRHADRRDRVRRLADRAHRRAAHLPHPSRRRPRQQWRGRRSHPRRLARRRTGVHHPGGGVVGRGRRWGRRRWHHVHWAIVRHMGLAWLVTMPATAALAAMALVGWRWLA